MPTKKKRASYSKSAHIAVQAQTSSLEDDVAPTPKTQENIDTKPNSTDTAPVAVIQAQTSTSVPTSDDDALENMLANDTVESELSKKNRKLYAIGFVATGCIMLTTIVLYLVFLKSTAMPVTSKAPATTPTPVPTVVVDVKTLTIEVLNGSGIAGKASKTADALKEKGYIIVSTGNAKKIPGTTVTFSSTIPQRAKEVVLSDLQSIGISSISATIIDSSVSARIILGLK